MIILTDAQVKEALSDYLAKKCRIKGSKVQIDRVTFRRKSARNEDLGSLKVEFDVD